MNNDQKFAVQRIRSQYVEREMTELDELRALDREAKRPANVFAYVLGSIGAIVMGAGMSLVMTEIGASVGMENALVPGVIVGAIGLGITLVNYPLYTKVLAKRKQKYSAKILELSDRIVN